MLNQNVEQPTLATRLGQGGSLVRFGLASLAIVSIAALWNPFYVEEMNGPPEVEARIIAAVSSYPPEVATELAHGVRIEQQIFISNRVELSEESGLLPVCVELTFVTYQRNNEGLVEVQLTSRRTTNRFVRDAHDIIDWGSETFCANFSGDQLASAPLRVAVSGTDAERGSAVAVLRASRTGAGRDRMTLPAATLREGVDELPVSLPAPLGLTATVGRWTEVDDLKHPFERVEAALILGIPMAVAVLVILLLALDLHRPSGDDNAATTALSRQRELRSSGLTLVLAGVLILTFGVAPALDSRIQIRLSPQELASSPERATDGLAGTTVVEQDIPASLLPNLSSSRGNVLVRPSDLCIDVGLSLRKDEDASGWSAVVSLETTVDGGLRQLRGRSSSSETISLDSDIITAERAVACFGSLESRLRAADTVTLRVGVAAPDGLTPFKVKLRPRAPGEGPARFMTPNEMTVLTDAVEYSFIQRAPSYREVVFSRIGTVALLVGGATLVTSSLRRRHRNHG